MILKVLYFLLGLHSSSLLIIILATAGRTADLSTWVPSQSSTMDPSSITIGTLSLIKGLTTTAHIVGKLVLLRHIPDELTKLSNVVRTPDICPCTQTLTALIIDPKL